ncbi:hypothetical protein E2C01_040581 [Portunus trituberculatus]|uniref:Uncharacterized protein n=1 Tax=Portunus trituberculatus TaxID=210409 RepID=A0A5B7FHT7_PORTR|nr:hypothetical protein [Portunus trituberculatus]
MTPPHTTTTFTTSTTITSIFSFSPHSALRFALTVPLSLPSFSGLKRLIITTTSKVRRFRRHKRRKD